MEALRRHAHTADNTSESDERRHINVREVVCERARSLDIRGKEDILKQNSVALLVRIDLLQIIVERILETGVHEILLLETGKATCEEGSLEVFDGQGEIEDEAVVCCSIGRALADIRRCGEI